MSDNKNFKKHQDLKRKYRKGIKLTLSLEEVEVLISAVEKYRQLDIYGHNCWSNIGSVSTKDACYLITSNQLLDKIPDDIEPEDGWCSTGRLVSILNDEMFREEKLLENTDYFINQLRIRGIIPMNMKGGEK